MRVAVMVIGLCMVMLVGMQSCAVQLAGSIGDNEALKDAGAIGVFVSFLFILGSAFAIGVPKASMWIFILAALISYNSASSSEFEDLYVWALLSLVLAVMSHFGVAEKERKKLP